MAAMREKLVLASNSPRRKDLLQGLGVRFSVDPADVDERPLPGEPPIDTALRLAREKASVASKRAGAGIVIAADTIVVIDGAVLGKPADPADAERMLRLLSGREHLVITGLAVVDPATGKTRDRAARTRVWFRDLLPSEIAAYVASGEPMDKAGAYGIQEKGALLVRKIDGCYFNVVGLPLSMLAEMLAEFGICLLAEC